MANAVYAALPTTIFTVMSGLAREHEAINLGQGFPDEPGPEAIRRAAAEAVIHGDNQYPPMPWPLPVSREGGGRPLRPLPGPCPRLETRGHGDLRGPSGRLLACAFLALIEPGDEVVLFAPAYDAYAPMVRRAGGVPVFVRLAPPRWRFDRAALEAAFSPRTRLVVLNNPLNPTATVSSEEDLALLQPSFCLRHDTIAVCDESLGACGFSTAAQSIWPLDDPCPACVIPVREDRPGRQDRSHP